ncbi:MAG: polyribonucleotide nucleotidyltransferase [Pseudomonadota bacterium]
MFQIHRKEIEWGGRTLTLETGRIARQADAAVLISYGDTKILCTVVADKKPKPGLDFFPLTVHYQEKMYAAGRIPGGYIKREGRPSEKDILTSRLIDRPIRPLFDDNFRNETQVLCSVLSHDIDHEPDVVALVGAAAALSIAGLPFHGPLGAARVGYVDGQFVLNPTSEQLETSKLDLTVAGTGDGVLMVESEAHELSEQQMLEAVMFGHQQFQPVIEAVGSLAKEVGNPAWEVPQPAPEAETVFDKVKSIVEVDLRKAYKETEKTTRRAAIDQLKEKAVEALIAEDEAHENFIGDAFKKLEKQIVRGDILDSGKRIDGRDTKAVRQIVCEAGLLSRVHGSALFTRGETQALVVTTLGTGQDEQLIEELSGERREHFMLHYNFPSYSVGETGRVGPPGRREIGHGKLAWRALHPIVPTKEEFPYTVRIVSEITESNGSSSMATVCGGSLALMDAGVPLARPVSGIAMGLIKEGEKFAVLSDILGDEDHLGDMDFKVAGTENGITSLQMDIKVKGITQEIMDVALKQAKDGRLHILNEMSKALGQARDDVSEHAPRMVTIHVPKDKIGAIIGPGGKMIREIVETSGAKIDIDDEGHVTISAVNEESINIAKSRIVELTAEPEIGIIYQGKVVKIMDFGAFVNFMSDRDGLVHISEISQERIESVESVVKTGQQVYVKVVGFDPRGKIKLSMKDVDQATGKSISSSEQPSVQA